MLKVACRIAELDMFSRHFVAYSGAQWGYGCYNQETRKTNGNYKLRYASMIFRITIYYIGPSLCYIGPAARGIPGLIII